MKFSRFCHKAVSMVVLVAFVALIQGYSAPAPATGKGSGETSVERGGDAAPGSFEKQSDEGAAVKKKKKFPWLLAGLGAVALGVAVYFLLIKKTKYTLTVTLNPGVSGIPLATGQYKKGEAVFYSYGPMPGYGNLRVLIDGVAAPLSGTIIMNMDHALSVGSIKGMTVQVNSSPAGAKIFVDHEDSGFLTPHTFTYSSAVRKAFLLRYGCGYYDFNRFVDAALGSNIVLDAVFKPGVLEEFFLPDSTCWQERTPGNWSYTGQWAGGVLTAVNSTGAYEFARYESPILSDRFTLRIQLKCMRITKRGTIGVILSTGTDMGDSQGYEFAFIESGKYVIYKNYHYDHYKDRGYWSYIKPPTPCPPRRPDGDAWNELMIIREGSNYTFKVNNELVYSFKDEMWNVRDFALGIFDYGMKVDFDIVDLWLGANAGAVPGQPVTEIPGKEGERGGER